ncbi:MAG: ROK family protein [Bacilli bacterium]|nr:ROK family protein [Bacilli bacterium]
MPVLGIDIGGTSIKGSLVNSLGECKENFVMPINPNLSQEETIEELLDVIDKYLQANLNGESLDGIGMGIPGSLDTEKGIVTFSNNLKWEDLKIVDLFKKRYKTPIKITNDANAAALGEARFGAGKEFKNMVMITLGTGVGSGIVIDGKLFEGYLGKGAELGHTTLVLDGLSCSCGRRGCFEMYASATALIRQTKEKMSICPDSLMHQISNELGKVDGRVAFMAAKKGDKAANEVVDQYVKYLSEGILNICNALRPECVVLSGGIAKEGSYLTDKVLNYCKLQDFGYPYSPSLVIKIAELGYQSGIVGAASLLL